MTLTQPRPARQRPAGTVWTVVQPGLWVGHRDGEFAGMIEADDLGFVASTHLARTIGTFSTVAEAKAAFHRD